MYITYIIELRAAVNIANGTDGMMHRRVGKVREMLKK